MTDITTVKQRFGIIGTSELLDRALEVAVRVAPTDLTVLVTGESGVGKEFFPQVIHAYSARKHNKYIAVNCGAIPEGTIDSELFGHEKGAFTGALEARKGYFEEADGGTIFLDEVAELPLPTQARLLRVLQTGEFIRVGSSKVQKTNVRVVAATNMNLQEAIASGRFREDLYYRLNTVPIVVPALRERPGDIPLLFRKFASDVAQQYRMPVVTLDAAAREMLCNYYWRGNIRQLKNVAEQISAVEEARLITPEILARYLPEQSAGTSVAAGAPRLYFGPRGSWDWAVQDLYARRELAGQRFPGLPVFLLGHSMGSFLARTYLIRYPGTVAGAILMGTGQMPPALVAAGRVVAAREARKGGDRHSSPLVNKLAFEAYNQKFAPNRTGYDWLSASTENVDQYLADPLCGGDPTIGLFREMLRGIACIEKQENLKRMNRNTPVLFLSGQDDPVGDMGKGVRRAYRSFRRSGVRDVEIRLYQGLRHEILQETGREKVYADVAHWLEAPLPEQ